MTPRTPTIGIDWLDIDVKMLSAAGIRRFHHGQPNCATGKLVMQ